MDIWSGGWVVVGGGRGKERMDVWLRGYVIGLAWLAMAWRGLAWHGMAWDPILLAHCVARGCALGQELPNDVRELANSGPNRN